MYKNIHSNPVLLYNSLIGIANTKPMFCFCDYTDYTNQTKQIKKLFNLDLNKNNFIYQIENYTNLIFKDLSTNRDQKKNK